MISRRHTQKRRPKARVVGLGATGLAAFSFLAAGCGLEDHAPVSRTVVQKVDTVVISSGGANIDVRTHRGRTVEMTVDSGRLSSPELEYDLDGRTLEIQGGCALGFLCNSTVTVVVPEHVAVSVDTDAGDVTTSGSPRRLEIATDAGDVATTLDRAPRSVTVLTDAGDIDIVVPAGRYAVTAETGAGGIDVQKIIQDDSALRSVTSRTEAGDVSIRGA